MSCSASSSFSSSDIPVPTDPLAAFVQVLSALFPSALSIPADMGKNSSVFVTVLAFLLWKYGPWFYVSFTNHLYTDLWSTLECRSVIMDPDEAYRAVTAWLSKQDFTKNARRQAVSRPRWVAITKDETSRNTYHFTPATGSHRFVFRGVSLFVHFARSKTVETLTLSVWHRHQKVLQEIIEEAFDLQNRINAGKTRVFCPGFANQWVEGCARRPRRLETVILEPARKEKFTKDLQGFLASDKQEWYASRGIPYRRGYLFYGLPGTGKSSLAFAAAGQHDLPIYILSLASRKLDGPGLRDLSFTLPPKCILLVEDVDSVFVSRTLSAGTPGTSDTRSMISFSDFLNFIDGVAAAEGRVLIMTTNHIDKLDSALIRCGRVDLSVEFTLAKEGQLAELFLCIFWTTGKDVKKNAENERLWKLSVKFSEAVPSELFSAAEVQGYLIQHAANPEMAIQGAERWVQERLGRKRGAGGGGKEKGEEEKEENGNGGQNWC